MISSAVRSPIIKLYVRRTCPMIASSILSPAVRSLLLATMPPKEITATSVVPPPMSTIILPVGSWTGRPAPMAAAMGSSINAASLAPAWMAASRTARFSTSVTPEGTETTTLGLNKPRRFWAPLIKWLNMARVISKLAIAPSFMGRVATMLPGVRPTISLALLPTAKTSPLSLWMATTDGSCRTRPLPLWKTSVLAVPKSIPKSRV